MSPTLNLAVTLLSARTREGHVCLDLAGRDGIWPRVARMAGVEPGLDVCRRQMDVSPLVGQQPEDVKPLMLMGNRLYLRRYFRAENRVAQGLLRRAETTLPLPDHRALKDALQRFFPEQDPENANMQKIAALTAAMKALCVIVGGPGTGKTTTVCRLLATLCTLAETPPEVVLTAPTGKAAGRLGASMMAGKSGLPPLPPDHLAAIPESASTLHRLLGLGHGRPPRHHGGNPLSADLVVVDEVSMVDLFLMARLMDALKPNARLILLGDRFQLSSVLPGAVLGEICKGTTDQRSSAFLQDFEAVLGKPLPFASQTRLPAMADCVVTLSRSWRFEASGGIGRLARSLNAGKGEELVRMLEAGEEEAISWLPMAGSGNLEAGLKDLVSQGFADLVQAKTPEAAFEALERFRILCVLRQGPFGAEGINTLVESLLEKEGLIRLTGPWYAGRPVIVLKNDPASGLFNGDVGITLKDAQSGELCVYFPAEGGGFRAFHPLRLPEVETVFAMTVHKSQGSEFDGVLLLLPDRDVPVLTREILYTAVTRARKTVGIAGRSEILMLGTGRTVRRASGLGEALWKV